MFCPETGEAPLQTSLWEHHPSERSQERRQRPPSRRRTGHRVVHPDGLPTEESHVHRCGLGLTLDGHSRDDPQCALRPDEELLQVIARVVLPQGGQAVQDGAIGQYLAEEERSKALHMGPRGHPSPPAPMPRGPSESRARHEPPPHPSRRPRGDPRPEAPNRAERRTFMLPPPGSSGPKAGAWQRPRCTGRAL